MRFRATVSLILPFPRDDNRFASRVREKPGAEMAFVQVAAGAFQMRPSHLRAPLTWAAGDNDGTQGIDSPSAATVGGENRTLIACPAGVWR